MAGARTRRGWLWLALPGLLWGFTAVVRPTLPPTPPRAAAPPLRGTPGPANASLHAPVAPLDDTVPTPHPVRLLYVWDAGLVGDPGRTAELLDFCRDHAVNQVAVEASPLGYDEPGARRRYREFVVTARAQGIDVLALGGCPWWTLAPDRGAPGQNTSAEEGLAFYATIAAAGIPFAGILDDSEPHATNNEWWFENLDVALPDYLAFLKAARQRVHPLPLFVTVPFWFDEDPRLVLAADGVTAPGEPAVAPMPAKTRTLLEAVQARVDGVAVMDYRDRAAGEDGLIHHARGEVAGGPTLIGVETDDLGAKRDKVTFWEEGRAAMEQELAKVQEAYGEHPNFRGFAIHHFGSYRRLKP